MRSVTDNSLDFTSYRHVRRGLLWLKSHSAAPSTGNNKVSLEESCNFLFNCATSLVYTDHCFEGFVHVYRGCLCICTLTLFTSTSTTTSRHLVWRSCFLPRLQLSSPQTSGSIRSPRHLPTTPSPRRPPRPQPCNSHPQRPCADQRRGSAPAVPRPSGLVGRQ